MFDNKPWHKSTGIWGSIGVLIGVVLAFMGIHITDQDMAFMLRELSLLVSAVGGIAALIGRLKASRGIGEPLKFKTLEGCMGMGMGTITSPDLAGMISGLGDQILGALQPIHDCVRLAAVDARKAASQTAPATGGSPVEPSVDQPTAPADPGQPDPAPAQPVTPEQLTDPAQIQTPAPNQPQPANQ